MAIRIEEKNIFLSVRDLVPAAYNQQILSSFPLPQRGNLGKKAQTRLQNSRPQRQGIFHSEYVVNRSFIYRDYSFYISGRIDGVFRLPERAEIEEIKTVILKKGDFSKINPELYPHFIEQLLYYAYLLQDELQGMEILTFLVIVNLIDNKEKSFPVTYKRTHVERLLQQRFQAIVSEIEQQQEKVVLRQREIEQIEFALPETREQQKKMMLAVDKALKGKEHLIVSAPTGTGKTAAALFPVIRNSYPQNKRVMFVTSKNSQQDIVKETLKQLTGQQLNIKVGFLKASQKMCANDVFFCHEAHCRFARDYRKRLDESAVIEQLLEKKLINPDEVFEIAVKHELCPFEVNIDASLHCDVVVGDYNYVFDPAARLRRLFLHKDLSDWILIIDEAHNLYERGRQYLSPQLSKRQVMQIKESLLSRKQKIYKSLVTALHEIEKLFTSLQLEGEVHFSGQQFFETDINIVLWQESFSLFEAAYIRYLIFKIRKGLLLIDDPLENFYFTLRRFLNVAHMKDASFVMFYDAANDGIMNIQCNDPAGYLGEKIDSFHSVIAMSATLDPIAYYREALGFPEYRTTMLELDSPFPKENRKIIIVPDISTRYRDRMKSYPQIAGVIKQTVMLKKGNYLVFFPSYDFMQNVNIFLGNVSAEKIIQRAAMREEEKDAVLKKLQCEQGAHLLLAVMGGIFSEGVDYNGSMAIGVIVVSPALPMVSYPRELLSRYYEEKKGAGNTYAYLYPGMNKVIQSVGRLIRSYTDKGIIVLVGERFAQDEFNMLLPQYWVDRKEDLVISTNYKKEIRSFWKRFD